MKRGNLAAFKILLQLFKKSYQHSKLELYEILWIYFISYKMNFIDHLNKRQKNPQYEHRTEKLDYKNNQFSSKKFHHIRKASSHKKILKAFGKIGICLNDKVPEDIQKDDLDKVCLILINDYVDDRSNELGVGPLNDGYLIGIKHHRIGFKIFYLYNPYCYTFSGFLGYFLMNTQRVLTIYYTGRDGINQLGIQFKDHTLKNDAISEIIIMNYNQKSHVIFINDCIKGGPLFNIHPILRKNQKPNKNMITLYVDKKSNQDSKENKRTHGIFTYYFCKIISDSPNITLEKLHYRMTAFLKRFDESFYFDITDNQMTVDPLFGY